MVKIIIIRGRSGSGKSTISYELARVLPNYAFIDIWKIKEMFEYLNPKNRKPHNDISKKAVFFILKEAIKDGTYKNFIVQESSEKAIKKNLRNYLKKSDEIYCFNLRVSLEDALKRNISREKKTMPKKHFIEAVQKDLPKIRKGEIVINTSEKSIKQVIEEILIVVKEKKSKKKLNVWKCV